MNATIETIGPAEAEFYLGKNKENRLLRKHYVDYISTEMVSGRWKENGEAIIIGNDGIIKDGQHRLSAIVKTGKTYRFVIVRQVENDVFSTIDCGLSRNSRDALALKGEVNCTHIASVLPWVFKYYSGELHHGGKSFMKNSPSHTVELLNLYPEARDTYEKKMFLYGPPSILGACKVIFGRIDADDCKTFFSRLISGEGLLSYEPEYLLRERLIQNKGAKAKLKSKYIFALVIKSWNYRRKGLSPKCLKYSEEGPTKEAFPIAI